MAAKIIVITGSNTGLGYATVKALMESPLPYRVFVGSRSADKGRAAVAELQAEVPNSQTTLDVLEVDVASDASIAAAVAAVQRETPYINVLVNNAGYSPEAGTDPREAWRKVIDVNAAGAHLLSVAFAPLLLSAPVPGRLLFISSSLGSLGLLANAFWPGPAPTNKGWPKTGTDDGVPFLAYRASKTALDTVMLSWHHLLKPDGVRVFSVCPGLLATSLGGDLEFMKAMGGDHPSVGAGAVRDVIAGKRDADAGKLVYKDGVHPL